MQPLPVQELGPASQEQAWLLGSAREQLSAEPLVVQEPELEQAWLLRPPREQLSV